LQYLLGGIETMPSHSAHLNPRNPFYYTVVVCIATLSGCTFLMGSELSGHQNVKQDRFHSFELTPRFGDKEGIFHEIGFGYSNGGARIGEDDSKLPHLREYGITWRYFPINYRRLEPFVGLGYGSFKLYTTTVYENPDYDICIGYSFCEIQTENTIASGWNPHGELGTYIMIHEDWRIVTKFTYEFIKDKNPFEFGDTRVMVGLAWNWDNL
jgi:hypothetical protein